MAKALDLIASDVNMLNLGLKSLGSDTAGFAPVDFLDWTPPAWGNAEAGKALARLFADSTPGSLGAKIEEANKKAFEELTASEPVAVDVIPAIEAIEGMDSHTIMHAGPPLEWENMCGPMRGGIIGAIMYEGLADNEEDALRVAATEIKYRSCNDNRAVGPMAGIVSPHMPMWVIENKRNGQRAYVTINEGWGRTLRFGAYDEAVIKRLHWMEKTLAKAMRAVIRDQNGINLKSVIAQALQMGDECHNRDISATNLLFKMMVPSIYKTDTLTAEEKGEVFEFLSNHEHYMLNLAMGACKVGLLSASNIPYSTMVTAMARNGYEVGIKVSGLGDRWFTAPAHVADGLYFPGYTPEDANPDIGDSAITETGGIGAFAMGTAPAIVLFVGGSTETALKITQDMWKITIGKNPVYKMPNLHFQGTPTGIDIRKVVDTNILPMINTGIAHKEAGHGLVGAGVVPAPRECFVKAVLAFAEQYKEG